VGEAERKTQRDIAHRQQAAFRVEFPQLVPQLLQVLRGRRARLRRVRRQRGRSGPLDGEQAEHAGDATSDHLRSLHRPVCKRVAAPVCKRVFAVFSCLDLCLPRRLMFDRLSSSRRLWPTECEQREMAVLAESGGEAVVEEVGPERLHPLGRTIRMFLRLTQRRPGTPSKGASFRRKKFDANFLVWLMPLLLAGCGATRQ
jgi:hypothetical protein